VNFTVQPEVGFSSLSTKLWTCPYWLR